MRKVIILAIILVLASGCSREMDDEGSRLIVQTPKSTGPSVLSTVDLSASCFAVNITAPDFIPAPITNSCGLTVGITSKFVKAGGAIEVPNVPQGNGRKIELWRYELASANDSCPDFKPNDCSDGVTCSVLPAGKIENVNLLTKEVTVSIILDVSNSTPVAQAGVCGPGGIKEVLTASGAIINESGNLIQEKPTADSICRDKGALEIWNSGVSSQGRTAPPYVFSITQKPDSDVLYGLLEGNKIVQLDGTGGAIDLTGCPFSTCSVPLWIHSISAGYGNKLFGLDASGGIHQISASGITKLTSTSPTAEQAIIY